MSDNAQKTNLRKLSFLGFGKSSSSKVNDGSSQNEPEVQLDEECAKVFAMDDNSEKFDLDKIHDEPSTVEPKNYGEKEYALHRKKSYPHMHAPLKVQKSTRRRDSNPQITPTATPVDTPVDVPLSPISTVAYSGDTQTPSSVRSPVFKVTDTDTGLMSPLSIQDQDDAALSSESDILLSDPSGFRSPIDSSPDRKVQFQQGNNIPDIPEDDHTSASDDKQSDKKDKKHRRSRHHHAHHPKVRKYSLPDDQNKRPGDGKGRRISTQPEDLPLRGVDRDQLESHRSDDARALRRHKTRNASVVHIGRKEGQETMQSPYLKKMYDHSPHAIFVQLDELYEDQDDREWKETARWIKYEEDVEEGVDRWGKPHVASLSFHSLLNLRKCLEDGLVILDMEEKDLPGIAYRISEDLYKEDLITESDKTKIMRVLLIKHRHVNEHHHDRGFKFPKKYSYSSLQSLHDSDKKRLSFPSDTLNAVKNGGQTDLDGKLIAPDGHTIIDLKEETYTASMEDLKKAQNETIFKKIPEGAQGSSVLVGKVDFLEQPAIAFVRLAEGVHIPFLFEVNIPVRFIFLLLGPPINNLDYHEVGRSISTLMANPQFHNIAYGADSRKALLSAINEFLDDSIVLPPGDWERQALLPIEELKAKSEQIRKRKENALKKAKEAEASTTRPLLAAGRDGGDKPSYPNPLERTRTPFGCLVNDIKRRFPHYVSDFTDGINSPCAAASMFMYFAALSTAITFGGLIGDKTDNYIGVSETLISGAICGIIFSLCAGQPLIITGTTGPLLLFDEALYHFCKANNIEFLTTRVYIGIWLAIISLFIAALEGSVLVKLFTRFTQEIYAALICIIYIVESVQKLIIIFGRHPLMADYCGFDRFNVYATLNSSYANLTDLNDAIIDEEGNIVINVTLPILPPYPTEDSRGDIINQPNTALMCVILSLGTFSIAYYLRLFRNSQFLGRTARRALGDFGVPIAIVIMVTIDYLTPQTFTDKLLVPEGISPSRPEIRSWFINPAGINQPFPLWLVGATCVPAMLVYVLLFMETHICELIVDKPERNLKKGSGFHLDIVVLCISNIGNGFFGTPWICAATVRSIAHVAAITIMSRTHAPGEKPHIIEVKEQRISNLVVSVLMGASVLLAPLLRLIPMAVLFGVFLYMGVSSTTGIQFFERLELFWMPVKHHPAASYVRKVRTMKMHLFTCMQLLCLAILWIVKSTPISLAFPFFLILMVPFRALLLTRIFTPAELRGLDNEQPDVDDDEPDFYAEAPLPG